VGRTLRAVSEALVKMEKAASPMGLKVNEEKTKCLVVTNNKTKCMVVTNNKTKCMVVTNNKTK
jgi:hypothetical protein